MLEKLGESEKQRAKLMQQSMEGDKVIEELKSQNQVRTHEQNVWHILFFDPNHLDPYK